jgi:DNA replication licensing factor MCM4
MNDAGTIDMDLITTGVSASERTRRASLVVALRNVVAEKMEVGGSAKKVTQVLIHQKLDLYKIWLFHKQIYIH